MRLSPNFTLAQLIRSDTAERLGIDNHPGAEHVANLVRVAAAMEDLMELLGRPLAISSGYRSPALNAAVGGASHSRHALGLAVDFTCAGFGSPLEVARAIASSTLRFDQLIHEYGRWVHLGLEPDGIPPRRQSLTICNAASGYMDGLVACA
jgi:hypothetical protein